MSQQMPKINIILLEKPIKNNIKKITYTTYNIKKLSLQLNKVQNLVIWYFFQVPRETITAGKIFTQHWYKKNTKYTGQGCSNNYDKLFYV